MIRQSLIEKIIKPDNNLLRLKTVKILKNNKKKKQKNNILIIYETLAHESIYAIKSKIKSEKLLKMTKIIK